MGQAEEGTKMNRWLKLCGVAVAGVLMIGAVSASAASAATTFTLGTTHTTLDGSQLGTDELVVNGGKVTCNEAVYSGTSTEASPHSIAVTPTYSECVAFGFVNSTIDMNGCYYEFTFSATTNAFHIKCPTNPIAITAFNCEVTLLPQTANGGIIYHNEGSGEAMDIEPTLNLTGLTYVQHSKSFPGCSTAGTNGVATSFFHDGKFNAQITLTGTTTPGTQVGITLS